MASPQPRLRIVRPAQSSIPLEQRPQALVVVVDPDTRALIGGLLAAGGVAAIPAADAPAVFDAIAARVPALIVLDAVLPDISGIQLCRLLRADPATAKVPVLMVVAPSSRQQLVEALEAGASELIAKPVVPEELATRAGNLLALDALQSRLDAVQKDDVARVREESMRDLRRLHSPAQIDRLATRDGGEVAAPTPVRGYAVTLAVRMLGVQLAVGDCDPARTMRLLDRSYRRLAEVAHWHDGTVLRRQGAILPVAFNLPLPQEDAGTRAASTAVDMIRAFRPIAREWRDSLGVQVGVGIGINNGVALAGSQESQGWGGYSLAGEVVDTAGALAARARASEIIVLDAMIEPLRLVMPDGVWDIESNAEIAGRPGAATLYRVQLPADADTADPASTARLPDLGEPQAPKVA